jgi:excinuclease ABC subunit C
MGIASILDSIPGVGPTRRKALLAKFGSLDAIRRATLDEIASTHNIGPELAMVIKEELE